MPLSGFIKDLKNSNIAPLFGKAKSWDDLVEAKDSFTGVYPRIKRNPKVLNNEIND